MKKKLNEIIYASIVMSVFFLVMGILLVVNPEISLDVISYMIATFLIINGIFLFVLDFKLGGLLIFFDNIISGVISVVLGILVLISPSLVSTFIPVVVGIWFIIVSIFKIRISLLFDDDSKVLSIILAIIGVITGCFLIVNPSVGSIAIILATGISFIAYSVVDIIEMIIFKRNLRVIEKNIKKYIDFE